MSVNCRGCETNVKIVSTRKSNWRTVYPAEFQRQRNQEGIFMPRRARGRLLYDGCFAHIYSRALEKRFIFQDSDDFELFRDLMLKTKHERNYSIFHYCLMNTHFHMVVRIHNLEEFSKGLKELKQEYTKKFNFKHERQGPVWWGRFGSQLIESEKYLYACGLYVEMNPVKAGMVNKAEDWEYSSSKHYFLGEKDEMIDCYNKPPYDLAMELTEGLNVGKGSYIGTPLYMLRNTD